MSESPPRNLLAGMALDYLLGADGPQRGREGRITETPFGEGPAALGRSIAYCNLRREDGEPAEFGPYLPHDDIFAQFGEGRPDPKGRGFLRNIVEQLDHCKQLGHTLVEEDNPDSYPLSAVMRGVELAQERGLGVIAKNPGLMKNGAPKYVGHPNVLGIIVEEDCGTPAEMDELRRKVGKPDLPVWFVSFGDGRGWAARTAQAITSPRFSNMSVTYSREGEYESSEDVLLPTAAPAPVLPVTPPVLPFIPPVLPFPSRPVLPNPAATSLAARIAHAMEQKGCQLDRNAGEINIVYVEGMNPDGTANVNTPNAFNDLRVCLVSEAGVWKIVKAWECTTAPGRHFTVQPLNPGGAAIIALGQQRAWQVGMHRGNHEALIQTGGEVIVTRDKNKDYKRTGDSTDKGWFGINQHWGYDQPVDDIGTASAGCLVGRTREGHREFMRIVKSDPRYANKHDFVFRTTVLGAADVLAAGGAVPSVPRVSGATAEQRLRMAKAIVDFEARRDSQGRLAVYPLPFGDGGGTYEVAGINDRYHPGEAAKLKALIEQGRHAEAEQSVREYLVGYTDVVVPWSNGNAGVEFYLRDCAFNRGPTGAALILQRAVGVERDGIVGPKTRDAVERCTADELLTRLRAAREAYEREDVGRDESSRFWNGLVNRWNKALEIAQAFSAEAAVADIPPTPQTQPQVGNLLPILLLVILLSKVKKPMADDSATPGQGIDLGKVLLPLLLQSMLTGKQIDTTELLSALLTGNPVGLSAPAPAPPPTPTLSPPRPTDLNTLLLPLLYQALTGKPLPGLAPPEPVKPPDPPPDTTPVIQKPSVQLSVAGLGLSTILQSLGIVGTPFNMGPDPTQAGTLATLVPIATAAVGATGGFGSLLNIGRALLGGLAGAAGKPK